LAKLAERPMFQPFESVNIWFQFTPETVKFPISGNYSPVWTPKQERQMKFP